MPTKVCFLYPWATFGGVERVLLNRALAFSKFIPETKVDFYFSHDSGGLKPLSDAIRRYNLTENIEIISSIERNYDLALAIDFPQAIDLLNGRSQRYVMECHTPYTENRLYLSNLPDECERVITPSPFFSDLLSSEFPRLRGRISELRNFVPWDIQNMDLSSPVFLPSWRRIPILFFGRLDSLKNPVELIEAYKKVDSLQPNKFMLLFCGPQSPEVNIKNDIHRRALDSSVVVLPPIPFASAHRLFDAIAKMGGIFVSPSKGESFGLSAAEAISAGVPVILSNIDAHLSLVKGFEDEMTYRLGDVDNLADQILAIFQKYEWAREAVATARQSFSSESFIKDWQNLFTDLKIAT